MTTQIAGYENAQQYRIDGGISGTIDDLEGNGILDPIDPIMLYTGGPIDSIGHFAFMFLSDADQQAYAAEFFSVASMGDLYGKKIDDILAYAAERKTVSLCVQAGKFNEVPAHLTAAYSIAKKAGFNPKESYEAAVKERVAKAKAVREEMERNCAMCQ